MRDEDEIEGILKWLKDEENNPEPTTMPTSGYIFDIDQAIEILEWILH